MIILIRIKHSIRKVYRVLYITPEYIEVFSDDLVELHEKIGRFKLIFFLIKKEIMNQIFYMEGISLVAIDECHCVSQWGNDFRPAYRQIGVLLREKLIEVPFMALTATATSNVRKDIVKNLDLQNPLITITSFDRFNSF